MTTAPSVIPGLYDGTYRGRPISFAVIQHTDSTLQVRALLRGRRVGTTLLATVTLDKIQPTRDGTAYEDSIRTALTTPAAEVWCRWPGCVERLTSPVSIAAGYGSTHRVAARRAGLTLAGVR